MWPILWDSILGSRNGTQLGFENGYSQVMKIQWLQTPEETKASKRGAFIAKHVHYIQNKDDGTHASAWSTCGITGRHIVLYHQRSIERTWARSTPPRKITSRSISYAPSSGPLSLFASSPRRCSLAVSPFIIVRNYWYFGIFCETLKPTITNDLY
jgi:hypothetical protein